MRGRRITWRIGGIGLIACGVVGVLHGPMLGVPLAGAALSLLADLLWAAAILVLAIGLRPEGSVVARRPLGLAAATVVALWPMVATIVSRLITPEDAAAASVDGWLFWLNLSIFLPAAAGLIAAVQVGRARVVPSPWNWAPLWVIAAQAGAWVAPQLLSVAAPTVLTETPGLFSTFSTLAFLAGTLGMGILALVLASRTAAGTVAVFDSSASEDA